MIIVEGCDGSGKDKLIERILYDFPRLVQHIERNRTQLHRKDVRKRVYEALSVEMQGQVRPLIYNRLYYSELVYGPILRGYIKFNTAEMKVIKGIIATLQVPVIVCTPPISTVKENLKKGYHLPGVRQHIDEIYDAYWNGLMREYPAVNTTFYNYTYEDNEEQYPYVVQMITQYLNRRISREGACS